jgi:hypothetical protein
MNNLTDKLKTIIPEVEPIKPKEIDEVNLDDFDEKSIPITFGESVNSLKIPIFKRFLEKNNCIKCYFVKEDSKRNNLFLYTDELIIKSSFKPEKKDIFIFYIGELELFPQPQKCIKSSIFDTDHTPKTDLTPNENIEKLYSTLSEAFEEKNETPSNLLTYCFKDAKDNSIELNFKAPKHYTEQDNKFISNLTSEIVTLFQHKQHKHKVILFTKFLEIETIIFPTNLSVEEELMKNPDKNRPMKDYDKYLVKGSVFRITQGDQKTKRKKNQHLISFLKSSDSEHKNKLIPQQKPHQTYTFKNIILTGVAGVGKTYSYSKLINLIENEVDEIELFNILSDYSVVDDLFYTSGENIDNRIEFITFHQNYSYEEFIEGFRPKPNNYGIKIEDGLFKEFVNKARRDKHHNYYFVIDEINRGNIAKIFGELITLIEDSKRDNVFVRLPYSKDFFTIPSNLFIIGTMNITDQSISKLDIALRRRFIFVEIKPNHNLVCEAFREKFIELNQFILENLGEDYLIGHSYFMNCNWNNLDFILNYQIKPLLQDYFYGDQETLNSVYRIIQ